MTATSFTLEELNQSYEEATAKITCECRLKNELVGGQPAGQDGIERFVKYQLKIEDPQEFQKAVDRIQREEVGDRDLTPEGGELKERTTYGVNVVRRTEFGPFLGDWMVKACFKQAASRLNLFTEKRGTKGNVSEAGRVRAVGVSLLESTHPERIYLRDASGTAPAATVFQRFHGSITSPQGRASIQHDSECVVPGSRFAFEYRMLQGKLKDYDVKAILGLMMVVGLGSVKSMERGKFEILSCTMDTREPRT